MNARPGIDLMSVVLGIFPLTRTEPYPGSRGLPRLTRLPQPPWRDHVCFSRKAPLNCYFFALLFFFSATVVLPGKVVTEPPALSIFCLAEALKRWAETV